MKFTLTWIVTLLGFFMQTPEDFFFLYHGLFKKNNDKDCLIYTAVAQPRLEGLIIIERIQ